MDYDYDDKDVDILRVLDDNARLSYREIAKKLGIHPNTVMERMKRMEDAGVIERYAPVVNYSKLGCRITALSLIDIVGNPDPVLKKIGRLGYVREVYVTTGEYDGVAIITCRDIDTLNRIASEIAAVPQVHSINTKVVLDKFGRNGRFEI